MCEMGQKLTRQAPDQMSETKFLQMCLFSVALPSFHSLNLSFPLLMSFPRLYFSFHLYSLDRHPNFPHFLHFHPDSSHSHTDSPYPNSQLTPRIPTLILAFSSFRSQIPHFDFYRYPAQLVFVKIYFRKVVALVKKQTLLFVTTA